MIEYLSKREEDILRLMADGLSNRDIADKLFLSFETVRWYCKQIFEKLEARNRTHAVSKAYRLGLLDISPTSGLLNNLPTEANSFIGRLDEIQEITRLLADTRLLTLTGSGGTGKTRLALQTVRKLIDDFPDGIFFVDLAPVSHSDLIAKTIAQVLQIGEVVGEDQVTTLSRVLNKRITLLLLDNFEHLLDGVSVVSELIHATTNLKILVTSRESLHFNIEQEYIVPPLASPSNDWTFNDIIQSEAIQLFVQRAQMVNLEFEPTSNNIHTIIEICDRLDNLPLAIELAAAHCKVLSINEILERLDKRLDLLVEGQHDLPARQQTLRRTIDWSFSRLDEADKRLIQSLAVFPSGRSLQAIQYVCSYSTGRALLNSLTNLVNKNLLGTVDMIGDETRFLMLETIHEYMREQLTGRDDAHAIYQRMIHYYHELAQQAEIELRLKHQQIWYKRLNVEHENIRFAIHWALEHDYAEIGIEIIVALRDFWFYQGLHVEGQYWLSLISPWLDTVAPVTVARTQMLQGLLAYARQQQAIDYLREAVDICRGLDDKVNLAWALTFLAFSTEAQADLHTDGIAWGEEGLDIFRQSDQPHGIAWSLNVLGNLKRLQGNFIEAGTIYEQCIEQCHITGEQRRISMVLGNLGIIAERNQQYEQAASFIRESIQLAREIDYIYTIPAKLSLLAGVLAGINQLYDATKLLSTSLAVNESMGIVAQANTQVEIDRYIANLRTQLGDADFNLAWEEGQSMSLAQAIEFALINS